MTAIEIKAEIKQKAKSSYGEYVVIKDTQNGGIYATGASASAIYGGGGVLHCIPADEIICNDGYYNRQYGFVSLDKISREVEKEWNKMYSKDDFMEMIKDWQKDNAPGYNDLVIDEPEVDKVTGEIGCTASDNIVTYILTDDGNGNIIMNYLGTK